MIGTQVSRYRILSRIGEGGMGEVFLALDPGLDRRVALKFLPVAQAGDIDSHRRLLSEAQAAARLDHPFVCKVYEVVESGERPFIAMEYVEGTTLYERLRGTPLRLKDVIRLASEIAEALDFAHQRGILHRDLKPSNIMVAADGHVRVLDFGVAKLMAPGGGGPTVSASGVIGTAAYMSPEQLRAMPLDARSDVFAFGLVLYEMATGAHPFLRSSPFSTAAAILNEPLEPIDVRLKDTPPLLVHIVSRCLEKERDQRYQSLRDVVLELRAVSDGAPQSTVVMRRHRRTRWPVVAAAVVMLAIAAGAVWVWPERSGLVQPALAFNERDWVVISDFENLTGDPVFDRSLRVALEVGITQSQYVNVLSPQSLQGALQRMQRAPGDRVDQTLAAEVAVREGAKAVLACSIAQIGDLYMLNAQLIDPRSRAAVLTESVQAKDKTAILGALDELVTTMRRRLGESLASISQKSLPLPKATTPSLDALKMYADSLKFGGDDTTTGDELLRQAILLDPEFALAHAELGRRLYLASASAARLRGEEHVARALTLLDRLTPRERLWIQASADDSRGERQRAADGYRTYLAQYPDDPRAWFRLGWTHMAGLGQYDSAVEAFQRTIALRPADAGAHVNLATSFRGLGDHPQAVEMYRKAFALDETLLTGIFVNHEYGFTLVQVGELDAASAVFGKMKATSDQGKRARGLRSQAWLEMYRGRYDAAIEELRQAIVINQATNSGISEFRDRLILARAFDAKSLTREVTAELAAAELLIARLSLGPEWLRIPLKIYARRGQVREARRLLEMMEKNAGSATGDSSTNRNVTLDQAHLQQARGEIALAEGKAEAAARLLEAALVSRFDPDTLESLAAALLAAGRPDDAAKRYEELIVKRPFGLEAQEHWFRAHVTLGGIYERLGRSSDARALYDRLLDLWKAGDADLTALREVKARH